MREGDERITAQEHTHTLNVRPLVIPDSEVITLSVDSRTDNFLISLDGRSLVVSCDKTITIRKAPFKTLVVKRNSHTFVTTLRNKLMWGADSRNS